MSKKKCAPSENMKRKKDATTINMLVPQYSISKCSFKCSEGIRTNSQNPKA